MVPLWAETWSSEATQLPVASLLSAAETSECGFSLVPLQWRGSPGFGVGVTAYLQRAVKALKGPVFAFYGLPGPRPLLGPGEKTSFVGGEIRSWRINSAQGRSPTRGAGRIKLCGVSPDGFYFVASLLESERKKKEMKRLILKVFLERMQTSVRGWDDVMMRMRFSLDLGFQMEGFGGLFVFGSVSLVVGSQVFSAFLPIGGWIIVCRIILIVRHRSVFLL